jgi:hypothetical protein
VKVLVDTSVWSLALRRTATTVRDPAAQELAQLIADYRILMIGPVRQEILSGMRRDQQFERLRDHLRAFPDLRLDTADYEHAATLFTACRRRGVQRSNTDFLICAAAIRRDVPVFTTDRDFDAFQEVLGVRLHSTPGALS